MPHFVLHPQHLVQFCERQGFQFQQSPTGQIAVLYNLLGQLAPLQFLAWPERNMLTLAMTLPFAVPAARNTAVSEALTTLNAMSFMGTWVLNTDKGELYFRDTLPVLDNQYSDDGLLFVAKVVVSTAERLAPALYRIACEGAAPETVTVVAGAS